MQTGLRATKNEDADYGCAVVETPHRADSESILSLGSFAVHSIEALLVQPQQRERLGQLEPHSRRIRRVKPCLPVQMFG